MILKKVVIIESPSNLGLKEKQPLHQPGVNKLPCFFYKYNFHSLVNAETVYKLPPPDYSMLLDEVSGVRNADKIIRYAQEQAVLLTEILTKGKLAIVLGGDCSILIGNALGLKQTGKYGLFFLDGHTDFITPDLSETGGAAGMDLAIVAGLGHHKLTNIENQKPYFDEENIWCIGNREYDKAYVQPIEESLVHYKNLTVLRQHGVEECATEFLELIRTKNLDGFWIHIDVDVLDDRIMPAVDSRQQDGVTYDEFRNILFPLISSEKLAGLEITIVDPELDPTGNYTKNFVTNFCNIFNLARRTHSGINCIKQESKIW